MKQYNKRTFKTRFNLSIYIRKMESIARAFQIKPPLCVLLDVEISSVNRSRLIGDSINSEVSSRLCIRPKSFSACISRVKSFGKSSRFIREEGISLCSRVTTAIFLAWKFNVLESITYKTVAPKHLPPPGWTIELIKRLRNLKNKISHLWREIADESRDLPLSLAFRARA